jgi:hypothetical protein
MVIEPSNRNRVIVGFDQAAIASQVGSDSVVSATLVLTIKATNSSWGTGKVLDLYRLTTAWTEAGATWSCAIDAIPGNSVADCSGATAWSMGSLTAPPWATPRTAQVPVTNGMSGTVSFNVTSDVRGFLAGTGNNGWILKAGSEGSGTSGRISFWTRERATGKPRLIIVTESVMPHNPTRPPVPDTMAWPSNPLTVASPQDPRFIYYRNVFAVRFDDSTSGVGVNAFLTAFGASIVGGWSPADQLEGYYVQTPDPGPLFAVVDSLRRAMRSRVGIQNVRLVTLFGPIDERGRFPVDLAVPNRSTWLGVPTFGTRPWLAVRAPVAWGCETGKYGSPLVRVAVLDEYFDQPLNPDLPTTQSYPPAAGLMVSAQPTPRELRHGTMVAGILGAKGDNLAEIAGMIWNSDMYLYSYGANGSIVRDGVARFAYVLGDASAKGVKVLNLSGGVGLPGDSAAIKDARDAIKRFIGPGPDRLLVIANGQDTSGGLTLTLQQLRASTHVGLSATDQAAAELMQTDQTARGGILFVTGTDTTGRRHSEAHVWTDADMPIAAPYDVLSISPTVASLFIGHGTSFAAPMVAGVAAQLWSMAPSLKANEVKSLIYDGARSVRLTATGTDSTPAAVVNASPTTYLLDAYGALSLLSKTRQGVPLCGVDVTMELNSSLQPYRLKFWRNSPEFLTLGAGTGGTDLLGTFAIAQGGRYLVVDSSFGSPVSVYRRLVSGTWQSAGATAGTRRVVFSEKDTIYIRNRDSLVGSGIAAILRSDAFVRVGSIDTTRNVAEFQITANYPWGVKTASWSTGSMPVSPDGNWLLIGWSHVGTNMLCSGPFDTSQDGLTVSDIWPLHQQQTGATQILSAPIQVWCGAPAPVPPPPPYNSVDIAWRPDGDQFLLVKGEGSSGPGYSVRFQRYDLGPNGIAPTGSSTVVSGMNRFTWWSPSGTYVRSEERTDLGGTTPCFLRSRGANALATGVKEVQVPCDSRVALPSVLAGAVVRR